MVALGFIVAMIVAQMNCGNDSIECEQVIDISMYVLLSAIVGARLFYVIQFWGEFAANPISVFKVWEGGMVFYGGLILSLVSIYIYTRIKRISFAKVLDIAAISLPLGYAVGRIGCFLRGCCYGTECSLPWAVHIPDLPGFRHPTQLYSVAAGVIIFILLLAVKKYKVFDGEMFLYGILFYSIYRFLLEFLRYSPYYYYGLTASQWISIAGILISLFLIIRNRNKPLCHISINPLRF